MPLNAATKAARLSVAPMMDWTDRHCRYLHRLLCRNALLYTEMVTAPALVRGGALHLLEFSPEEHPVALQLGGSDPVELSHAARLGQAAGYDEINLNVGCPSDRVQSGCFGAVLMEQPGLVAECVAEMRAAVDIEVTVKCRIGVDDQTPEEALGFTALRPAPAPPLWPPAEGGRHHLHEPRWGAAEAGPGPSCQLAAKGAHRHPGPSDKGPCQGVPSTPGHGRSSARSTR